MRAHTLGAVAFVSLAVGCQKMEDYTSKEWGFRAKFPGKPQVKQQSQSVAGQTIQFTMFMVESRNWAYMVGVSDMPLPDGETQAQIQRRLDDARDGAVGNIGATLSSSSEITFQGKYPGREFAAKLPPIPNGPSDGQIRCRIYLVGKRMYQTMVLGTPKYVNDARATEFLNSFQLLN